MDDLRVFMNHILEVKPPYGDLMHNGIPGQGASNVAADKTNSLYRAAQAFAVAYRNPDSNNQTIGRLAGAIEADLMVLLTYSVVSEATAHALIQELYDLVEAKFPGLSPDTASV